jgi:hypothetical protein
MSVYDAVMQGMGFVPKAVPKARPEPLRPHEQGNWPMGMARPDPRSPSYGREMDRFSNWRSYTSPLGGVSNSVWGIAPKVGEAALRPEFRRSQRRWGGR